MYFLDTCICVEFLRGRLKEGYRIMRAGKPDDFQLPSIVVAELFYGAEHSANPERERAVVEAFVGTFTVASFDTPAARKYAELRQELGTQGKLIGDRDIMIAACALAHSATLVTRNIREFQRVKGLPLESWDEQDF